MEIKKLILAAICFSTLGAFAQNQHIDPRISEILKEKVRTVPTYDANKNVTSALKTAGNGEGKISNITQVDVQEAEGFIAINPTDSNKMVLSYMENSSAGLAFPVYTTNNGGTTWTKSNFDAAATINNDFPVSGLVIAGGGDPVFAYDSDGTLYFSWIYLLFSQNNPNAYFAMYWAISNDNGATFQLSTGEDRFIGHGALNIFTGGVSNDYGDGILDRQWHAVDRSGGAFDGRLYTTGLFIPNDSTQLNGNGMIIKWKNKNASAFDTVHTQLTAGDNGQFGNVVVSSTGNVHVTFCDLTNNNIYHRKSTDGGNTFSAQKLIYDGNSLFSNDSGTLIHDRENSAPNLVIGKNNSLHLAWGDFVNDTAYAFYSRSVDEGATWSTPIELGTFLDNNNAYNMMPVVAVDNANNPSISWYGLSGNKKSIFYNIQSLDGGVSFLAPTMVSGGTTDYSTYVQQEFFGDYCNAVKTGCKTIALWSDGRSGSGPKMYVGTIDHCASIGIKEITPLGTGFDLLKLYPNPVKDELHLTVKSNETFVSTLQISSINGAVVAEKTIDIKQGENEISLPISVASGQYILQITTPRGDQIVRKLSVAK